MYRKILSVAAASVLLLQTGCCGWRPFQCRSGVCGSEAVNYTPIFPCLHARFHPYAHSGYGYGAPAMDAGMPMGMDTGCATCASGPAMGAYPPAGSVFTAPPTSVAPPRVNAEQPTPMPAK